MAEWNPALYRRYEDERTRPAIELLARVPLAAAARVVDLGCGPGNSTELLVRRFPQAQVTGTDNSEAMLVSARERLPEIPMTEDLTGSTVVGVLGRTPTVDRSWWSRFPRHGCNAIALPLVVGDWEPTPATVDPDAEAGWLAAQGWRTAAVPADGDLANLWRGLDR